MSGIKTRAGVKSLVTTNLPSGTGAITAANHRDVHESMADSAVLFGEAEVVVINMTTAAPPGSSSDRDAYVVAAGATGAWAGQDGKIAVWDATISPAAWVFVVPVDGAVIFDRAENRRHRWDASISPSAWVSVSRYDMTVIVGTTPSAGEILFRHTAVVTEYLPANLSGSRGTEPDTLPDASFAMTVQKVDKAASPTATTTLGTVTISTVGAYTFATSGGAAKTVSPGEELQVVAPSDSPAEASIAGFSFTMMLTAADH